MSSTFTDPRFSILERELIKLSRRIDSDRIGINQLANSICGTKRIVEETNHGLVPSDGTIRNSPLVSFCQSQRRTLQTIETALTTLKAKVYDDESTLESAITTFGESAASIGDGSHLEPLIQKLEEEDMLGQGDYDNMDMLANLEKSRNMYYEGFMSRGIDWMINLTKDIPYVGNMLKALSQIENTVLTAGTPFSNILQTLHHVIEHMFSDVTSWVSSIAHVGDLWEKFQEEGTEGTALRTYIENSFTSKAFSVAERLALIASGGESECAKFLYKYDLYYKYDPVTTDGIETDNVLLPYGDYHGRQVSEVVLVVFCTKDDLQDVRLDVIRWTSVNAGSLALRNEPQRLNVIHSYFDGDGDDEKFADILNPRKGYALVGSGDVINDVSLIEVLVSHQKAVSIGVHGKTLRIEDYAQEAVDFLEGNVYPKTWNWLDWKKLLLVKLNFPLPSWKKVHELEGGAGVGTLIDYDDDFKQAGVAMDANKDVVLTMVKKQESGRLRSFVKNDGRLKFPSKISKKNFFDQIKSLVE
jgi:hypothetical protein